MHPDSTYNLYPCIMHGKLMQSPNIQIYLSLSLFVIYQCKFLLEINPTFPKLFHHNYSYSYRYCTIILSHFTNRESGNFKISSTQNQEHSVSNPELS